MSNYIRFDWVMKRLLGNKANFAVLEGFLTTLLRDRIKIQKPPQVNNYQRFTITEASPFPEFLPALPGFF